MPQVELRFIFDLYAGVRPARLVPGVPSPIVGAAEHGIDLVLIRESTEGLFASMGKGVVTDDEARETLVITRRTSERLFDFSLRLAARGPGRTDIRPARLTERRAASALPTESLAMGKATAHAIICPTVLTFREKFSINNRILLVGLAPLLCPQSCWDVKILTTQGKIVLFISNEGRRTRPIRRKPILGSGRRRHGRRESSDGSYEPTRSSPGNLRILPQGGTCRVDLWSPGRQ